MRHLEGTRGRGALRQILESLPAHGLGGALLAVTVIAEVCGPPAEPGGDRAAEFALPLDGLGAVLWTRVLTCAFECTEYVYAHTHTHTCIYTHKRKAYIHNAGHKF